jgi:hypothetical protein
MDIAARVAKARGAQGLVRRDARTHARTHARTPVLDPAAPLGLGRRDGPPGRSAAHLLVTSPLSKVEILAFAEGEAWRASRVESGLFEIVKVWVQDAFLVEFTAQDRLARYADAFGPAGLATLGGKLRRLEQDLAQKLAAAMPPERFAAILAAWRRQVTPRSAGSGPRQRR